MKDNKFKKTLNGLKKRLFHREEPSKYTLPIFIVITLLIAAGLVGWSMELYNISGAAQLDLSRPGYVSVRSKAMSSDSDAVDFSDSGKVSKQVIEDFKKLLSDQAKKAKAMKAFSGDPLASSILDEQTQNTN